MHRNTNGESLHFPRSREVGLRRAVSSPPNWIEQNAIGSHRFGP
jgi:hypothetical protein